MIHTDAKTIASSPEHETPEANLRALGILRFEPILIPKIWGGSRIAQLKHNGCDRTDIGESWEISAIDGKESIVADGPYKGISLTDLCIDMGAKLLGSRVVDRYGNRFPLLIKFIDAHSDLSFQVHPDDKTAMERHNSLGKTEMWHIVSSEPGAKVYVGFKRPVDRECYDRCTADNTISEVVGAYTTSPGDSFYIPAGRIHAIGAGNLLVEIQQSSDISYRIYDYDRRDSNGNLRQLHIDEAREAIDYSHYDDCRNTPVKIDGSTSRLISCDHFCVDRIDIHGSHKIDTDPDSFTAIICIDGGAAVESNGEKAMVSCGQTLLVAAGVKTINVSGQASLLTARV